MGSGSPSGCQQPNFTGSFPQVGVQAVVSPPPFAVKRRHPLEIVISLLAWINSN